RGLSDDVTIIILCNKYNKGIYNLQAILGILGAHVLPVPDEEGTESDSTPDTSKASLPKCPVKPAKEKMGVKKK
ncbi:MAG TPA: hypothetical protein VFJ43_06515, partial [Bacteroidia bacterium]|nr:hypothetical protein [Bacteroidia bacterium]